jgi:hypothetical protein
MTNNDFNFKRANKCIAGGEHKIIFKTPDGKWRIECCCSDNFPTHGFLLISKNAFINKEEMETSINELISNILYWTQHKFNNYFNGTKE